MKFRIFLAGYGAANVSLVLYGGLTLITPRILLEPFSTYVYQFPADAAGATAYLAALFRLVGFLNIIPGMLGLVFLRRLVLTQESWVRHIVIVSTVLAYLGPVVFDNTVGRIGFFEIVEHFLFGLVIVLGLIMWRERDAEQ